MEIHGKSERERDGWKTSNYLHEKQCKGQRKGSREVEKYYELNENETVLSKWVGCSKSSAYREIYRRMDILEKKKDLKPIIKLLL